MEELRKKLIQKMDDRVKETGEKILTRKKIGRNEICPCGKKFKKCCIGEMKR